MRNACPVKPKRIAHGAAESKQFEPAPAAAAAQISAASSRSAAQGGMGASGEKSGAGISPLKAILKKML